MFQTLVPAWNGPKFSDRASFRGFTRASIGVILSCPAGRIAPAARSREVSEVADGPPAELRTADADRLLAPGWPRLFGSPGGRRRRAPVHLRRLVVAGAAHGRRPARARRGARRSGGRSRQQLAFAARIPLRRLAFGRSALNAQHPPDSGRAELHRGSRRRPAAVARRGPRR